MTSSADNVIYEMFNYFGLMHQDVLSPNNFLLAFDRVF